MRQIFLRAKRFLESLGRGGDRPGMKSRIRDDRFDLHELGGAFVCKAKDAQGKFKGPWLWDGPEEKFEPGDELISADDWEAEGSDANDLFGMFFSCRGRLAADEVKVRRDGEIVAVALQ